MFSWYFLKILLSRFISHTAVLCYHTIIIIIIVVALLWFACVRGCARQLHTAHKGSGQIQSNCGEATTLQDKLIICAVLLRLLYMCLRYHTIFTVTVSVRVENFAFVYFYLVICNRLLRSTPLDFAFEMSVLISRLNASTAAGEVMQLK